jgi:hypothetical protein
MENVLFDFLVSEYDDGDLCEFVHDGECLCGLLIDATDDSPAQLALAELASLVPATVWNAVGDMILEEFDE